MDNGSVEEHYIETNQCPNKKIVRETIDGIAPCLKKYMIDVLEEYISPKKSKGDYRAPIYGQPPNNTDVNNALNKIRKSAEIHGLSDFFSEADGRPTRDSKVFKYAYCALKNIKSKNRKIPSEGDRFQRNIEALHEGRNRTSHHDANYNDITDEEKRYYGGILILFAKDMGDPLVEAKIPYSKKIAEDFKIEDDSDRIESIVEAYEKQLENKDKTIADLSTSNRILNEQLRDRDKKIEEWQRNLNNPYSSMDSLYFNGELRSLKQKAEHGSAEASFKLSGYYDASDPIQSLFWLKASYNDGYAPAETQIGYYYYIGDERRSIKQSFDDAYMWFKKAADQNDSEAQLAIATMYMRGRGVKKSHKEALDWFIRSAEQGNVDSQYNLALMYDNNVGVRNRPDLAVKWYTRAAENGDLQSQLALYQKSRLNDTHNRRVTPELGMRCLVLAADEGSTYAQKELAKQYMEGDCVETSYSNAIKYLEKAASTDRSCSIALSIIYYIGMGVEKNIMESEKWLFNAPKMGWADITNRESIAKLNFVANYIDDEKEIEEYDEWAITSLKEKGDAIYQWIFGCDKYKKHCFEEALESFLGASRYLNSQFDIERIIAARSCICLSWMSYVGNLGRKDRDSAYDYFENAINVFKDLEDIIRMTLRSREKKSNLKRPVETFVDYYIPDYDVPGLTSPMGNANFLFNIVIGLYQSGIPLPDTCEWLYHMLEKTNDEIQRNVFEELDSSDKTEPFIVQEDSILNEFKEGLLNMAVRQGNKYAQYSLANYNADMAEDSFRLFRESANKGYPRAMKKMGDLYYERNGTVDDYREAMNWYEKAISSNGLYGKSWTVDCEKDPAIRLSRIYYEGKGGEKSIIKAIRTLRLSKLTERDRLDFVSVLNWERFAVDEFGVWCLEQMSISGNTLASFILGKLYYHKQSYADAFECFKTAMESYKSSYVALNLCRMYYEHIGTDRSIEMAEMVIRPFTKDASLLTMYKYKVIALSQRDGTDIINSSKIDSSINCEDDEYGSASFKKWLIELCATNDNIFGQLYLSWMHYTEGNNKASEKWFNLAYINDGLDALYGEKTVEELLFDYINYIPYKNPSKIVDWLETITDSLGVVINTDYSIKFDYSDVEISWITKKAEKGDIAAQALLGHCYSRDDISGFKKSYKEAFGWYMKAANQGDADAQYNLGEMYENGQGVEQSNVKAFEWYSKAAEQGYADAQNSLGRLHEHGLGVQQSYEKAVYWYSKAAEQNSDSAKNNLGWLLLNGNGAPMDHAKAFELFSEVKDGSDGEETYRMAVMYEKGLGVGRSEEKAAELYNSVASRIMSNAENGCMECQFILGEMYEYGRGVDKDPELAEKWYRTSAENGDIDARKRLGMI